MKKRRAHDYEKLFNRLQSFCIKEFNFSIFNETRIVITDYEKAVFTVLRRYGCHVQGCFFHFTQCVYRKVKQIGLVDEYNKYNSTVHLYVRLLMMVAFIKPSMKPEVFNDLVRSFSSENLDNGITRQMSIVFKYFKDTWLNGSIDVNMWYFSGCEMNTNNRCESIHSGFTAMFPNISHPNMFTLANMICAHEKRQMNDLMTSTSTSFVHREDKRGQSVAETLKVLNSKYSAGLIQSLKGYLVALNNSFSQSTDYATVRIAPGIDGLMAQVLQVAPLMVK